MRSVGSPAEDKAGAVIASWQKSVIRKARPLLGWLSTSPHTVYPSPFGWCSVEIPQEQPRPSYLFTSRHLQTDKEGTACPDFSPLCLREARPAARSSDEGPVNPWDNPSRTDGMLRGPSLFEEQRWSAVSAATLTKLGHRCRGTDFIALAKAFQLPPPAAACVSADRPHLVFQMDLPPLPLLSLSAFCLASLLFLPPPCLVQSFSPCLSAKLLLPTGRTEGLSVLGPSLFFFFFLVAVASGSSASVPVSRCFWLVVITFSTSAVSLPRFFPVPMCLPDVPGHHLFALFDLPLLTARRQVEFAGAGKTLEALAE